jgi:hypothetical protein
MTSKPFCLHEGNKGIKEMAIQEGVETASAKVLRQEYARDSSNTVRGLELSEQGGTPGSEARELGRAILSW